MRRSREDSLQRRQTRSMAHSPIDVEEDSDSSPPQPLLRRTATRRGKEIMIEPEHAEGVVDEHSSSSASDNLIRNLDDEETTYEPSYNEALRALKRLEFVGTYYLHRESMVRLGIAKDVDQMLRNCGLTEFVSSPRPGYKNETIQFLASVELRTYAANENRLRSTEGFGALTFRVNGANYSFSATQFEELFGLTPSRGLDTSFDREETNYLWQLIASPAPYIAKSSRSTRIRNPAIRYFHTVIANTCFARYESGNVRTTELDMIDLALKDFINSSTHDYGMKLAGNLNNNGFTKALMEQFIKYKKWASALPPTSKSKICVGGIVTRILEACSAQIKSRPTQHKWIDIPYLAKHKVLRKASGRGTWLYRFREPGHAADSTILLPNPDITALGLRNNISFMPPADLITQPRVARSPQPQQPEPTEQQGEEPECYHFDEYIDPKMPKRVKMAHKNLAKAQKAIKLNTNVIRFIL